MLRIDEQTANHILKNAMVAPGFLRSVESFNDIANELGWVVKFRAADQSLQREIGAFRAELWELLGQRFGASHRKQMWRRMAQSRRQE